MMRLGKANRRIIALIGLTCLAFAACRGTAPAIDLEELRAAGRILDESPKGTLTWGLLGRARVGSAPFSWSGSGAPVRRETCGTIFRRASRLVVEVEGPTGVTSAFVLDTGSSCSYVSTAAAMACDLRVYDKTVVPPPAPRRSGPVGRPALLPSLRIGSLTGRDAALGLMPESHDLDDPTNILGMDLLWSLVLRHRGGEWSLVNAPGFTPDRSGIPVQLQAPGLPILTLVDESGRRVHGLIDTAAPWTVAVTEDDEGSYELRDASGRCRIQTETVRTADWPGLRVGGHAVTVLIGLEALASIDFDLHLGGGMLYLYPRR